MITLRLDEGLEQDINKTAKQMGLTKSELIRKSISTFIENLEKPSPYESGRELFGQYGSGQENLSQNRKSLLKDKIKSKHQ